MLNKGLLLICLLLLVLLAGLYVHRTRQLQQTRQALLCLQQQQEKDRLLVASDLSGIGEPALEQLDSDTEVHRIWSNLGSRSYVLRLQQETDSTMHYVFKQFTLQNPLTKEGKTVVLKIREGTVSMRVLSDFKARLSRINLPDAALYDRDIMCCFGGGTLHWEARTGDNTRHEFSTFCRHSLAFAEACEALLDQCGFAEIRASSTE